MNAIIEQQNEKAEHKAKMLASFDKKEKAIKAEYNLQRAINTIKDLITNIKVHRIEMGIQEECQSVADAEKLLKDLAPKDFNVISVDGTQIIFEYKNERFEGTLWASCDRRAPYGRHELYTGIISIIGDKKLPKLTYEEEKEIQQLCREANPIEVESHAELNAALGLCYVS